MERLRRRRQLRLPRVLRHLVRWIRIHLLFVLLEENRQHIIVLLLEGAESDVSENRFLFVFVLELFGIHLVYLRSLQRLLHFACDNWGPYLITFQTGDRYSSVRVLGHVVLLLQLLRDVRLLLRDVFARHIWYEYAIELPQGSRAQPSCEISNVRVRLCFAARISCWGRQECARYYRE